MKADDSQIIDDLLSGIAPGDRRRLARSVVQRLLPLLAQMVERASASTLEEALAEPAIGRCFDG